MKASSCALQKVRVLVLLVPAVLAASGCGLFDQLEFEHLALPEPDTTHLEEDKYRERYQSTRDPNAIRWLLAHRIENGMDRSQVEAAIGQPGQRELNDHVFKKNNNAFRTGDKTYKYGPDNKGHSYYLIYRENKLVGFDPTVFQGDANDPWDNLEEE